MLHLSTDNALLLQACFTGNHEILRQWESSVDIEAYDHDMHALLPLLKHFADQRGQSLNEAARMNGVRRFFWTRNTVRLRAFEGLLAEFRNAGITPVVMGDVRLAQTIYEHTGLRSINQFDLLVNPRDKLSSIDLLQCLGWTIAHPIDYERLNRIDRLLFMLPDQPPLTLRWFAFERCGWQGVDDDLWTRAQTVQGMRVLSLTDQLLHTAAQLDQHYPALSLADTLLVLNKGNIDWGQFAESARHYEKSRIVADVFSLLEKLTHVAIPVTSTLRQAPVHWTEWIERRHLSGWGARLIHKARNIRHSHKPAPDT